MITQEDGSYPFCPECGQTIYCERPAVGQMQVCPHCGKHVGVVKAAPQKIVVDKTAELIQGGSVARCPLCQQAVEVKAAGAGKAFVPHFAAGQRKMCPNSGKPVADAAASTPAAASAPAPIPRPVGVKDFSAQMTRDFIKVVSCSRNADPKIEELTLEYLDRKDRVRLQIDALRDILGPDLRMKGYPPTLHRPHLAVWGNAMAFVVAKKHDQGGYQQMADAEMRLVMEDLKQHRTLFFD